MAIVEGVVKKLVSCIEKIEGATSGRPACSREANSENADDLQIKQLLSSCVPK
jgi:hypothetical protein